MFTLWQEPLLCLLRTISYPSPDTHYVRGKDDILRGAGDSQMGG